MSAGIVHRSPTEGRTVCGGSFIACGYRPPIALSVVQGMIDVTVKVIRSVIPRPSTDENSARKPLGSVIAVWGAVVRRRLIVSVGTDRSSDSYAR
jgi:hypothetical protein